MQMQLPLASKRLHHENAHTNTGDAIKRFFAGLSGPAMERAIKEVRALRLPLFGTAICSSALPLTKDEKQAFDRFDKDKSGLLEQDEFQEAMHVLGVRLSAAEYGMLFNEYDVDSSGSINLVLATIPAPNANQ
jgi:hypothetical protein